MIFFASDYHFSHKNIIKYTNRPFDDILEMNSVLMKNWNKKITEDDLVFFCGDFMFGNPNDADKILERLNGQKILIKGNHDRRQVCSSHHWLESTNKMFFTYEDYIFHLCHYPHKDIKPTKNNIYIHGHSHGYYGKISDHQIDVSCENWEYSPVSIETIIKEWNTHAFLHRLA